jgi:plastocyanin
MKKPVKFLSTLFIVFSLCMLSSCEKTSSQPASGPSGGSTGPGANEVWMQNDKFNPAAITISVNTTVTWKNKDNEAHTVTSSAGLFNSGNIGANGTYAYTFMKAGTYNYSCTIHANMTGTVIVK